MNGSEDGQKSRAILAGAATGIVVGVLMGFLSSLAMDRVAAELDDRGVDLQRSGGPGTRAFFRSLDEGETDVRFAILWGSVCGGASGYGIYRWAKRKPKPQA